MTGPLRMKLGHGRNSWQLLKLHTNTNVDGPRRVLTVSIDFLFLPTAPLPPDVQQGQGYVLLYCLLTHLLKTNSRSGLFFHRQIVLADIQLKALRTKCSHLMAGYSIALLPFVPTS